MLCHELEKLSRRRRVTNHQQLIVASIRTIGNVSDWNKSWIRNAHDKKIFLDCDWQECWGRNEMWQQPAATTSRPAFASISGIYNTNPNGIQTANDVQNPMRLVRRHIDATIKSNSLSILLRRRWRRHVSIFPSVSTLPFCPNDHVVGVGFTFAGTWSVIWSRWHGSWHGRCGV
jgi:hypothetical protein